MKLVTAIINPFKATEVREALLALGVVGITVVEIHGWGHQRLPTAFLSEAEHLVDFLPKALVEIAIDDARVERVLEVVASAAKTGNVGDGRILVTDLERVVRIRNEETDANAI
jgi:nitrogen regulatory protein P-II 2